MPFERIRFAATQLKVDLGNVEKNFAAALKLIDLAIKEKAQVVVLPEFFTSGIAISDKLLKVPEENRRVGVIPVLREKAIQRGVSIAGSILNIANGDVYNSMFLFSPSGQVSIHNKDIPTQFENAYYRPGDSVRSFGKYGVALCWELLRTKTIGELSEDVSVVLAGSCWWSLPVGTKNVELNDYNKNLNRLAPEGFASAAGLPVVHASLIGKISTQRSLEREETIERTLIGTTKIVDNQGQSISQISDVSGDDIIVEEIALSPRKKRTTGGDSFWLVDLREEYKKAWEIENKLGVEKYKLNRPLMVIDRVESSYRKGVPRRDCS